MQKVTIYSQQWQHTDITLQKNSFEKREIQFRSK